MGKTFLDGKYRLMAPGPVQISEKVRQALSMPMIHHRTPEFQTILEKSLEKLKFFFQTKQPVMILPSTGSGGMEAAIVNLFSAGDEVAVIVSGKFGQRWADMARVFELKVHIIDVPWGQPVQVDKVKELLDSHPEIKGVLTQACETSTGTWHPIQELATLIQSNKNCVFIVDAITAIGCTKMPFDLWGIDVLVAGSQKALALPTGLAFICLSEKAWKFNQRSTYPKYYFNLLKERQANEKSQTFFSSTVNQIRALSVFLEDVEEIGLDALIRRTTNLAQCTQKAAENLGLELFSQSPATAVTAIVVPEKIDGQKLRLHMESTYNVTVMGGQDHLKGKIIRIGHMGNISNTDQLAAMEALAQSLIDLGHPISEKQMQDMLTSADEFLKMCSNV